MDTDPADQRHQPLKQSEHTGDAAHFLGLHVVFIQPVRKGHGKSVHGKANTKQRTVKKENEAQFHKQTTPDIVIAHK